MLADRDWLDDCDVTEPESDLEVIDHCWAQGYCNEFAVTMNILTGWSCAEVRGSDGTYLHTLNRDPLGRLVDVTGYVDVKTLANRYGHTQVTVKDVENHEISHILNEDSDMVLPLSVMLLLDHQPYSELREEIKKLIARL
jgi:hypothetical protein